MRTAIIALLATSLLGAPAAVSGQVVADVMGIVRDGGGWVAVPISDGAGSYSSNVIPSMGMSINGCVQVAPEHSGAWVIQARDRFSSEDLLIEASPGVGVPFTHTFGLKTQIDFQIRWSARRDTTLVLWVGLGLGRDGASCEPSPGS